MTDTPRWIGADAVHRALGYPAAVAALDAAVRTPGGHTPPRQIIDTAAGQLLLMPSEAGRFAGVKVVTVAPGNAARGLPRISGVYVLFDAETLTLIAQLDGPALTAVRTAAVSALAVTHLARPDATRLAVFGTGPQGRSHLAALAAVRPLTHVDIVARRPATAEPLVRAATDLGLTAEVHPPAAADHVVAGGDLIACCTTAREPLFTTTARPDATVVAVGSHEPAARELPADLVTAATVVVESRASAASAGDLVLAGRSTVDGDLADLVAGRVTVHSGQPRVFKSVGEAWEDLAVAAAIYAALSDVDSSATQAR